MLSEDILKRLLHIPDIVIFEIFCKAYLTCFVDMKLMQVPDVTYAWVFFQASKISSK